VAHPACVEFAVPKAARESGSPGVRTVESGFGFDVGEFVVYPTRGVGEIIAIDERDMAGFKLELFVIRFDRAKMTLMVPLSKAVCNGMRKLADAKGVRAALEILAGRARIKRATWARRALEYRAKINSGDLIANAEVVRDLFRSPSQPEQSGAEREMYEAARDRVVREIALVRRLTETESLNAIEAQLQNKSGAGKSGGKGVRNRSLAVEVSRGRS
jgi:CarD family transcriptional regulator